MASKTGPMKLSSLKVRSTKSLDTKSKKSASSSIGAPAQRNQASRKGKRAWRKNIDIEAVEERLEDLRAEERLTGEDGHLFQIDTQGDDRVRRAMPRFSMSLLTSTKILNERSAVPAVHARTTASTPQKRKLSHDEKSRLLRLGKRLQRGPLNGVVDPSELGAGSALLEVTEAAKQSGQYDVWAGEQDVEMGDPEMPKLTAVKAPKTTHPRSFVAIPAVAVPHQGTSYNPVASAHTELLRAAIEVEEQRAKDEEQTVEWREKMEQLRAATLPAAEVGVPPGMHVGGGEVDDEADGEDGVGDAADVPKKKAPERKTKKQRMKAAKLLAEKRALAEKAAKKRLLVSVAMAKSIRTDLNRKLSVHERVHAQRAQAAQDALKLGLAGRKFGKHKVAQDQVDVQLGEELSENLRTLKPEGNLFHDRFVRLQQRGLLEPRALSISTKKRGKAKEYEKHAWKR